MYLLVNLDTGELDGFYASKDMAQEIVKSANASDGQWLLTRVMNTKNLGKAHLKFRVGRTVGEECGDAGCRLCRPEKYTVK